MRRPAASAQTSREPRPAAVRTPLPASPVLGPKSYAAAPLFPRLGAQWKRDRASRVGVYEVSSARTSGTSRHYGVRVWQELLTEHGLRTPVTGIYDRRTAAGVAKFQRTRRHLQASGQVDYPTARALLAPTIRREAKRVGMPADLLCGHLDLESLLDPQAVNANGRDLGLAQINIGRWNPGVVVAQAFDEDYAIRYMATRDAAAYRRYGDWRIAIYHYNWPADARLWKSTGRPSARGAAYSAYALRGCDGPEFPGSPPRR